MVRVFDSNEHFMQFTVGMENAMVKSQFNGIDLLSHLEQHCACCPELVPFGFGLTFGQLVLLGKVSFILGLAGPYIQLSRYEEFKN
jgi:hypothetical protein